jgi:hypothetical protein
MHDILILNDKTCSLSLHIWVLGFCLHSYISVEPMGKYVFVLHLVFSQDYPLSSKEEACEIDKVKEEAYETEITVEEHSVILKSSDDIQRLVCIYNSVII